MSRRYLHFLHYSGLSVSIGQIRWYTTYFNRLLLRVGQWKPGWLQTWFTWGVYFGILAMFGAVGVLGMTLVNAVKQKPAEKQVLTPVVRIVKNINKQQHFCNMEHCSFSSCSNTIQRNSFNSPTPKQLINEWVGWTS